MLKIVHLHETHRPEADHVMTDSKFPHYYSYYFDNELSESIIPSGKAVTEAGRSSGIVHRMFLLVVPPAAPHVPAGVSHYVIQNESPDNFIIRASIPAVWTGLEPATPGVTGRYSNQAELPHPVSAAKLH